jgi:hypothetical protein
MAVCPGPVFVLSALMEQLSNERIENKISMEYQNKFRKTN